MQSLSHTRMKIIVKELMNGLSELAPEPQIQKAIPREILPEEKKVSGFVFKVQANMDPKHRDRVAFVRVASGHFRRGIQQIHQHVEIKPASPLVQQLSKLLSLLRVARSAQGQT